MKRTHSDRKYRPIRREFSRYGILETVLTDMKNEGVTIFCAADISQRTKKVTRQSIGGMLKFTKGIQSIKQTDNTNCYVFSDTEQIRVDAG